MKTVFLFALLVGSAISIPVGDDKKSTDIIDDEPSLIQNDTIDKEPEVADGLDGTAEGNDQVGNGTNPNEPDGGPVPNISEPTQEDEADIVDGKIDPAGNDDPTKQEPEIASGGQVGTNNETTQDTAINSTDITAASAADPIELGQDNGQAESTAEKNEVDAAGDTKDSGTVKVKRDLTDTDLDASDTESDAGASPNNKGFGEEEEPSESADENDDGDENGEDVEQYLQQQGGL